MKKILVPTDLTPIADLGLDLAVEIAKRCDAEISLINFKEFSFLKSGKNGVDYVSHDIAQAKLDSYVAYYRPSGVSINAAVSEQEFKEGIDDFLEKEKVDLIVIGTSGNESGEEVINGNHTQNLIKLSSCPVLSVREGFKIEYLTNVVVAVDVINDNLVAVGLKTVKTIADCFKAHVHLVHVLQDSSNAALLYEYFNKLAVASALPDFSVHILEAENEIERVVMYARQVRAGLIAVLKNTKNNFFSMFARQFSDVLIKEVGRPVFTVNVSK